MLLGGKANDRFLFKTQEESRNKMTAYIRSNFGEMLGEDAALLDRPDGLEALRERVRSRMAAAGMGTALRKAA